MKLTTFCNGTLLLVLLTACSGLLPAPTETSTPIPLTETPTTTIVWFPATNTPSPFPTQMRLPTPEQRPGLGQLLFSDTFDQPGLWNTSTSDRASASVERNRLLLSISGTGPLSIISLRSQPVLTDFYAEASVKLSLCGSADQYGMIFRAASSDSDYRFTVRCDGQERLERLISGSNMPLNNWLPSGDAPLAAPAEVKIGVWAAGSEMRFFLNDTLQFSLRDPLLRAGTLGFFAYASGADPITVAFSDLSVYSVSYVLPTLTPLPPPPTP